MAKNDYSGTLNTGQIIFLIILPIVCFIGCLCLGRLMISPVDIWRSFAAKIGLASPTLSATDTVIWSIRIPRLLLAATVGIGLSVAGCTYQGLFNNPLATPDTLGVASGASFGAALALLLGFQMLGVQVCALLFGLLAVGLTWLSGAGLVRSKITPILAGIMISSLFGSLISLVKFTADTESQLPSITYWLMGSMESADYNSLLLGVPPVIICTVILLLIRWKMNLLTLPDDEAISTGVNLKALKIITNICATIITASCISMCGQVGWVGLLVPHICRMRYGNNNVSLLPACIGIGAAFMIVVDTLARTVSPKEIPISVLTAIIGAPFFIYLLRSNR
ncbi:MAG: iron ABC transporter permease, partial [Oscillospiraceae bacterium]|nr:iron ABC transporter permease [Candidatus Equicaccousia limihippi]